MRAILSQVVGEVGAETNVALTGWLLAPSFTRAPITTSELVSNTLLLEFLQDDGSWDSNAPTMEAPCFVTARVHNTTNFTRNWDVAWSWGYSSNEYIVDPDPSGRRISARGTNRDLSEDQRGPWCTMYYPTNGTYTLTVNARDDTTITNAVTHSATASLSVSATTWVSNVSVGSTGDYANIAAALAGITATNNYIRIRMLDENHVMTGSTNVIPAGRRKILIEADSGLPRILMDDATVFGTGIGSVDGSDLCDNIIFRNLLIEAGSNGPDYATGANNGDATAMQCGKASRCGWVDITLYSPGAGSNPAFGVCGRSQANNDNGYSIGTTWLRCRPETNGGLNVVNHCYDTVGWADYLSTMGCYWGASRVEDGMRLLGNNAYNRRAAAVRWCEADIFYLASNSGKEDIRGQQTQWSWFQESWLHQGFNVPASTGGTGEAGTNEDNDWVAEGMFLGSDAGVRGQDSNPRSPVQIGTAGHRWSIKSCLVKAMRTNTSADIGLLAGDNPVQDAPQGPGFNQTNTDMHFLFNTWALGLITGGGEYGWSPGTGHGEAWGWSNSRWRGNLVSVADGISGGLYVFSGGAFGLTNTLASNSENVYPTNGAFSGNFSAFPGATDATFTNYVDGLGGNSVNEIQEAHSPTNMVQTNSTNEAWIPYDTVYASGTEGTNWRTAATPDPRCRRDYIGNLREFNTNTWSAGAIATNGG